MGIAHWGLEKAILFIVPANIPAAGRWLEDISFGAFCLIYVYLLWDMIKVFIPRLQSGIYPGLKAEQDDAK